MIVASDGSYYTGITTDINRRFKAHFDTKTGAKYFRGRRPLNVVCLEDGHTRSSASKCEAAIKKLNAGQKHALFSTRERL